MNVLITHPDFDNPGGVSGYYKQLENKHKMPVMHFIIGRRPQERGLFAKVRRLFLDYANFVRVLRSEPVSLIQLSPSLDPRAFVRESLFVFLATVYKKKTIVFFFGWKKRFEASIQQNYIWLFRLMYNKVSAFVVQANRFREQLQTWGFTQPVHVEGAIVDDDLVKGFDISKTIDYRQTSEIWRILFLARVIKEKGIYETIEAFSILQARCGTIELVVAGDGEELSKVRQFVHERDIEGIKFVGYVRGAEKRQLFESSCLYCLPTSYGEGMPGSMAEAMAFGLPVVTRPVGGMVDFFKNGEHGFTTPSLDPRDFADLIEKLFANQELYRSVSMHNYRYAQANFLASKAVLRLEEIYRTAINECPVKSD